MFPDGVVLMMARIADPGESNEKQQCVRCFPTQLKKRSKMKGSTQDTFTRLLVIVCGTEKAVRKYKDVGKLYLITGLGCKFQTGFD